jgi:hypothetical protein
MADIALAKSRLAELWDRADGIERDEPPLIERIVDPPASLPPGFTLWRVNGSMVALPTLDPTAPAVVQQRYLARVCATATGHCLLCGAVAGVSIDPERAPAAFRVLEVGVSLTHSPECAAQFAPHEVRYFPVLAGRDPRDFA